MRPPTKASMPKTTEAAASATIISTILLCEAGCTVIAEVIPSDAAKKRKDTNRF